MKLYKRIYHGIILDHPYYTPQQVLRTARQTLRKMGHRAPIDQYDMVIKTFPELIDYDKS